MQYYCWKIFRKTTTILFNNTSYTFNFFFLTKLELLIKNNPAPLKHDIEISDKIPIGYLVDSKNKPVDMNTLINDKYLYTLFYFWSHTCAGCQIELKRLNDFPEKFKSKNVRIILVSPLEEKSNIIKLEKIPKLNSTIFLHIRKYASKMERHRLSL